MIIAKTNMATMPERCAACHLYIRRSNNEFVTCAVIGANHSQYDPRPSWCPLEEQPTTNCSQSEQTFTVKKGKWGSWSGDIWEVNNKHGELVGHITEFGFKLYDQPVWGTPLELRQLADLIEETLEGKK